MDSALAFFAGGWGSIPLAGSKNLPIEMAFSFSLLGIGVSKHIQIEPRHVEMVF